MNLLPYVMLMLVVVSLTISSVIQNSFGLGIMNQGMCEYMKRHRSARSLLHNTVATTLKRDLKKSVEAGEKGVEKKEDAKTGPYISSRRTRFLRKSAKLNLMPLITAPANSNSVLNKTFLSLLQFLYGHLEAFDNPETLKVLAEKIVARGKEAIYLGKKDLEYVDIYPKERPYADLFYLLMTGSKNYNVENYIGIPPLSDFVILDAHPNEKAISFQSASFPVLVAHFGPHFTDEILKAEQEKSKTNPIRKALSEVELSDLIKKEESLRQTSALLLEELRYGNRNLDEYEVSGKNGKDGPIQVRLSQPLVKKSS
jgi:hypothetical protein